jgi:hypothetical protein
MLEEMSVLELVARGFVGDGVCMMVCCALGDLLLHEIVDRACVSGGCGLLSSDPLVVAWLPIAAFSQVTGECLRGSGRFSHPWSW